MKALKAYFLSLHTRERILISSLCLVGGLIGLYVFSKNATVFWKKESVLMTRIKGQKVVIASSDAVDKRAREAAAKLVPTESLSLLQLTSRVTSLAQAAGIRNPGVTGLPEEAVANSNVAIHAVRVNLSSVPFDNLWNFYGELEKRRPYITIDEMSVNLTDQKTAMHSVNMKLSSIEVKQP